MQHYLLNETQSCSPLVTVIASIHSLAEYDDTWLIVSFTVIGIRVRAPTPPHPST